MKHVKAKQIKLLHDGLSVLVEYGTMCKEFYLCTSSDFCPEKEDGLSIIEFRNGAYSLTPVVFIGQTTDEGALFDIGIKFLLANDIPFDRTKPEDINPDLITPDGDVTDFIEYCDNGEHFFVPSDFIIKAENNMSINKIFGTA